MGREGGVREGGPTREKEKGRQRRRRTNKGEGEAKGEGGPTREEKKGRGERKIGRGTDEDQQRRREGRRGRE